MGKKKKIRKKDINRQLLHSIFALQDERKYIHSLAQSSLDNSGNVSRKQKIAEAKYLFLLKEARHRDMSLFRY